MIEHPDLFKQEYVYVVEQKMKNFSPWLLHASEINNNVTYVKFILRYAAWKDVPYETICDFLNINNVEKKIWESYYMAICDCSHDFHAMVTNGHKKTSSTS